MDGNRFTATPTGILNGYAAANLVWCFEQLGLWDLLAQRDDLEIDDIAARLHVNRARLGSLVQAGRRYRMLAVTATGRVSLAPLGRRLVEEKGRIIVAVGGYGDMFGHLAELTNETMSYGDDVNRCDVAVATGCAQTQTAEVNHAFDRLIVTAGCSRIADVGCADASRLIRACCAHPDIRGIGIDVSDPACNEARRRIAEAGLSDRISIINADIAEVVSRPGDYAAVLGDVEVMASSFMLHHFMASADGSRLFMRQLIDAFPTVRYLIIADHVRTSENSHQEFPLFSIEFELLHDFMDVSTPRKEDYEALFEDAGLRIEAVLPFGHPDEWVYLLCRA